MIDCERNSSIILTSCDCLVVERRREMRGRPASGLPVCQSSDGEHQRPTKTEAESATTGRTVGLRRAPIRGQHNDSLSLDKNSNIEARNSKQYQMTQIQMTKTFL